eukprot:14047005-Alexandrium_andersonii.AAC.1
MCIRDRDWAVDDTYTAEMMGIQGKPIEMIGEKSVDVGFQGWNGGEIDGNITFDVASVSRPVASAGRLRRLGYGIHLAPEGCWVERDGRSAPIYPKGDIF